MTLDVLEREEIHILNIPTPEQELRFSDHQRISYVVGKWMYWKSTRDTSPNNRFQPSMRGRGGWLLELVK